MEIKYTTQFLNKLEDIFSESDYVLRYEKGNFNSGYCVLKDTKIAIVNKYYTLEGKINSLVEIMKEIELSTVKMSDKNIKMYHALSAQKEAPADEE